MSLTPALSHGFDSTQVASPISPVSSQKHSLQYRPGVDGLRAIAVLSVVIFHLNHRWLRGGFVGVDVFFVISGYLITLVLLREYELQSFNLAKFYQRRIARIFPAFFTVALATVVGAFFIYSPQDLASSGANLSAAALSVVNMKFIMQGNYFALSPDAQPFLHCWSLSVEEQFYLFFPLFLLVLHLKAMRYTTGILIALAICSFLACILLTHHQPTWAFFLLPTRAWELLAGTALANYSAPRASHSSPVWNWIADAGLLVVFASFFFISESDRFPGYIASLPVLGTVLYIGPNRGSDGLAERFLSLKPMVLIGRLSYSLYLWHWPIFSLIDYKLYASSPELRIGLKLGLTCIFTITSFLLIENPTRSLLNQQVNRRVAFAFFAVAIVVFTTLGTYLRKQNYVSAEIGSISSGGLVFNPNGKRCSIVLMGDSNGSMYGRMMRQIADENGYRLHVISVAAYDPLPRPSGNSPKLWTDSLAFVKTEKPDFLILVCNWEARFKGEDPARLAMAVNELKKDAAWLILVTQPPVLPPTASREAYRNGIRPPFMEDPQERKTRMAANTLVRALNGGNVIVLDIERHFETENGEIIFSDANGNQYYHDGEHLSGYGADVVKADMLDAIQFRHVTPATSQAVQ